MGKADRDIGQEHKSRAAQGHARQQTRYGKKYSPHTANV